MENAAKATNNKNNFTSSTTTTSSSTITSGHGQQYPVTTEAKKRPRTAFTPEQIKRLEDEFHTNKYLSVGKRLELSKALKLTETQVNKADAATSAIFPTSYRCYWW